MVKRTASPNRPIPIGSWLSPVTRASRIAPFARNSAVSRSGVTRSGLLRIISGQLVADRQMLEAVDKGRLAHLALARQLDRHQCGHELLEQRDQLAPGEMLAEADMRAIAERDLIEARPIDIETLAVGDLALVAIA